jgi:NADH-quinone oxidoreductase subunit N
VTCVVNPVFVFWENPFQFVFTHIVLIYKVYSYSFNIVLSRLIVLLVSFFILYLYEDNNNIRYSKVSLLLLWLNFFIFILLGVTDFFVLFIILEIIAIISVVFIVIGSNTNAIYNSLLYFFLNIVFGGLFLVGLWFLYTQYHTLSFFGIQNAIMLENNSVSIGFLFITFVFFFKLGAAPFHFWTLDIYEKLMVPVFLIFNVVLKFVMFVTFFKILIFFSIMNNFSIQIATGFVAVLSLLFGILSPLIETRFFRVMLFSSLYILGFSLLPVLSKSVGAYLPSFHFFFSYLFIFFFFFIQILPVSQQLQVFTLKFNTDLGVLLKKTKYPVGLLYLTFFNMGAIPPFILFWFKANLFVNFLSFFNLFFVFFLLVLSVISTFIYFRFVKLLATDFTIGDFFLTFHIRSNFQNFIIFLIFLLFPYFLTYFTLFYSASFLF